MAAAAAAKAVSLPALKSPRPPDICPAAPWRAVKYQIQAANAQKNRRHRSRVLSALISTNCRWRGCDVARLAAGVSLRVSDLIEPGFLLVIQRRIEFVQRAAHKFDGLEHRLKAFLHRRESCRYRQRRLGGT
jgi:hypothetical protein